MILACLFAGLFLPVSAAELKLRILAANTAEETGIVRALADEFGRRHARLRIHIESGGALRVLERARRGDADLVITHHPEAEALFVNDGFGTLRTTFMYNEFAIFGPPHDPLRLARERDLLAVLKTLARQQVPFLTPGARSGTTAKLNQLWSMAGVEPGWVGYENQNLSAAAALRNAALFQMYTFADLGTYFANRQEVSARTVPLYRDHLLLRNHYSALVVRRDRIPTANQAAAESFLDYLVSESGQHFIRTFSEQKFGSLLFTPAADLDEGLRARRHEIELTRHKHIILLLSGLTAALALLCGISVWLVVRMRRSEHMRRKSEERFELAVAGSNDGIWDWEIPQGRVYCSLRMREILGLPATGEIDAGLDQPLLARVCPDDREALAAALREYLRPEKTGALFEAQFRVVSANNVTTWVILRGKALRDAQGHAVRMTGSITDITRFRQVEEAVRAAQAGQASAETANQAKSAFLANMSHEIRTPLTAIVGFADSLLDTQQPLADRLASIQSIARNGRHLVHILNDILDLSKIEADKIELERISMSPFELVEDIRALMTLPAEAKGLKFEVQHVLPLPATVVSDPVRLKQVLFNLCSNAIKFTKDGGIHLRVSADRSRETLQFEVHDTGVGLGAEQQARLFSAFSQADSSTTREYGGTGLGLYLSRRLARILGGDIQLQSMPGAGSCFTLVVATGPLTDVPFLNALPAVLVPDREAQPTVVERLAGRVLLAEDNPDNQRLISMYVTRTGAEVVIAENGSLAVARARDERFDLVLMDMQMPVMDGLTASRQLRVHGYRGPIVALTANAFHEDRVTCMQAGCTDFLSKPIHRGHFYRVLGKYLQPAAPSAPDIQPIRSSLLDEEPEFMDLVLKFVSRLPLMVADLERSAAVADWVALAKIAHDLKGLGAGYGYPQVTAVAAKIEFETAKQDRNGVAILVGELRMLAHRIDFGVRDTGTALSPDG